MTSSQNIAPFDRCLMVLADGARPDILQDEMQKGNLPTLQKYWATGESGGTHQSMATVFPSTTGPAYLPYLTGCFPGTCDVPGIRWFDPLVYHKTGFSFKAIRSYVGLETFLLDRDINPKIKTAFDLFKKTVVLFSTVGRGVRQTGIDLTRFSRIFYLFYAHLTNRWNKVDDIATQKTVRYLKKHDFDFLFLVYPSIDEYSHRISPTSDRVRFAYREMDARLKKIIDELALQNKLDRTLRILVSDHGLSDTTEHFDVGPWLELQGVKTLFHTPIFKRNFKAASMVSGNGMVHLYFKGSTGWNERSCFESLSSQGILLDLLRSNPAVQLVAVRGGEAGVVHLLTDRGHGSFKKLDENFLYQWDREDPLGIFTNSSRTTHFLISDSLKLTAKTDYIDLFCQLDNLFTSSRSGDVILSARSGYDFRKQYEHPLHKGSHGGFIPEQMLVPFLMNYPLSPQFQNQLTRSVDVFPTILKLLGKAIPPHLDGNSLI